MESSQRCLNELFVTLRTEAFAYESRILQMLPLVRREVEGGGGGGVVVVAVDGLREPPAGGGGPVTPGG